MKPVGASIGLMLLAVIGTVFMENEATAVNASKVNKVDAELRQALEIFDKTKLPIGTKQIVLKDSMRNKEVRTKVTYPEGKGPFPVIVFSHGGGGTRHGYFYAAECWAQHGYVVIQPTHADSIVGNLEQGKRSNFGFTLRKIPTDKQGWIDRAGDVSFIIDSLAQVETLVPEISGKLDAAKIGVGGHSYGAFTTQILVGAKLPHADLAPTRNSVLDSRVKAAIAISPQGVREREGAFGFDSKEAYHTISAPTFFLTGDRDGTGWTSVSNRKDAYLNCPAGDKYFVSIDGANHMTFAGGDVEDPHRLFNAIMSGTMPEAYGDEHHHLKMVMESTTLFWDAYLKGDVAAKSLLKDGGMAKLIGSDGHAESR